MAGGGFCNVTNIESMTDEDKKRCTEMTEPKDLAHPLKELAIEKQVLSHTSKNKQMKKRLTI